MVSIETEYQHSTAGQKVCLQYTALHALIHCNSHHHNNSFKIIILIPDNKFDSGGKMWNCLEEIFMCPDHQEFCDNKKLLNQKILSQECLGLTHISTKDPISISLQRSKKGWLNKWPIEVPYNYLQNPIRNGWKPGILHKQGKLSDNQTRGNS